MTNKTNLDERLMRIHVALENCLREPLSGKLAGRGFTAEKINEILDLYHRVVELKKVQEEAYHRQYQSTEALNLRFDEARQNYQRYRTLAQVALADQPSTLKALQLSGPTLRSLSGFVAQARQFYLPVLQNPQLGDKLLETGLTRPELEQEIPRLEELEQLNIRQEYEKKAAQDATQQKDERLAELNRRMADLYKVARVALEDDPQFLEILGLNA